MVRRVASAVSSIPRTGASQTTGRLRHVGTVAERTATATSRSCGAVSVHRDLPITRSGHLTSGRSPERRVDLEGSVMGNETGLQHIATFCGKCDCGCPELFIDHAAAPERRIVHHR